MINDITELDINDFLVQSRFGEIKINKEKKLFFNEGIVGVCDSANFCLANFPGEEKVFKILQSVEEVELSFIVLPLNLNEEGVYPLYNKKDINSMIEELDIKPEDLLILLICNFQKGESRNHLYVNLQAPLIIDANKMAGVQYIMDPAIYPTKYDLTEKE